MTINTTIGIVFCKTYPTGNWRQKWLVVLRFVINLVLFFIVIVVTSLAVMVFYQMRKENEKDDETLFWKFTHVCQDDEKIVMFWRFAHVCEWIASFLFIVYILTLFSQFEGIEISLPKVTCRHSHCKSS